MTDVNGITGARLVSKVPTKEYQENYDKIFGTKESTKLNPLLCQTDIERPAQTWEKPQQEANDK